MEPLRQLPDAPSTTWSQGQPEQLNRGTPGAVSAPNSGPATANVQDVTAAANSVQHTGSGTGAPTTKPQDPTARTLTMADAFANVGSNRSMVTDIVFGSDNKIAQIRVIDPTTHEVIAATPPDTMARFEREVMAYQQVAKDAQVS